MDLIHFLWFTYLNNLTFSIDSRQDFFHVQVFIYIFIKQRIFNKEYLSVLKKPLWLMGWKTCSWSLVQKAVVKLCNKAIHGYEIASIHSVVLNNITRFVKRFECTWNLILCNSLGTRHDWLNDEFYFHYLHRYLRCSWFLNIKIRCHYSGTKHQARYSRYIHECSQKIGNSQETQLGNLTKVLTKSVSCVLLLTRLMSTRCYEGKQESSRVKIEWKNVFKTINSFTSQVRLYASVIVFRRIVDCADLIVESPFS